MNTNYKANISVDLRVVLAIVLGMVLFALGIATTVGVVAYGNHKANIAYNQAVEYQNKKEAERLEAEHRAEVEAARSNINRDVEADAYAIRIAAISEIAGKYKTAEMSNLLDNPATRTELYDTLSEAIDAKTQYYLTVYDLAVEKAAENFRTLSKVHPSTPDRSGLERQWQKYNESCIKQLAEEMKIDLGNRILEGGDIL